MSSASACLGSRAHRPRLLNSGMWSVTSVNPVPEPVASPPGQPARLLPPVMHSSRARKSRRKSAVSCRRRRSILKPGCTSMPSVGAQRAGLVVLDRLIGGLHDAGRCDAEAVIQRLFDRFHAFVEHLEVG